MTNIRIKRYSGIVSSSDVAMIILDHYRFMIGEYVMIDYTSENNKIETILTLGIKNGKGRDCYSVLSVLSEDIINDIRMSDISDNVNGWRYIWYNTEDNKYYLVELGDSGVIKSTTLLVGDHVFRNLKDNYRWFFVNNTLKREDSFLSRSETIDIIHTELDTAIKPTINVEYQDIYKSGNIIRPQFSVNVINYLGNNITDDCIIKFYVDDEEVDISQYTISETTEFTITIEDNLGIKNSIKKTIYFVKPVLYNQEQYTLWHPVKGNLILNLDNIDINQSIEIKIPKEFETGIKHIYDDSWLDYIDDYILTFDSDYAIYTKIDKINISKFKQEFIYEE